MAIENFNQKFPNNPDASSGLNVGNIQGANVPGYTDAQLSQDIIAANQAQFAPQAIGPQGGALYPGLRHNINVGNQSGSIIGSQGVYVPGGNIMPVDPLLARRKALDDAARAKAASITPFDPGRPGQLKDPRFQEKFDKAYYGRANELIDSAKKKYGKDFGLVLQNQNTTEGREFIQEMANYETLRREFDGITDRVASIDEGLETGELEFSDKTLAIYDDYKQLIGSFDKGDVFKSRDLQSSIDQLDGFLSLEHYIQQGSFLDDVMGQQLGYSYNADTGEFFETTTGSTTTFDTAIDELTDSLIRGPFRNHLRQGYMTSDDVKDTLKSRFKKQTTVKKSMQQKSAATRGAETEEIIAGVDTANKFSKDAPGSGEFFDYDDQGNRLESFTVNPLMDVQMTISGSEKKIFERTPDGKVQEVSFRGIPLDNVQVVTPDGQKSIPGKVYAEIGEMTKLADGRIVHKARVAVPTKQEVEGDVTGQGEGEFDSYTFEDRLIVIEKDGKGTGTKTEVLSNIKGEEARKNYEEAYTESQNWTGGGDVVGELD